MEENSCFKTWRILQRVAGGIKSSGVRNRLKVGKDISKLEEVNCKVQSLFAKYSRFLLENE